jgi:hypothetical protein
MNQQLIDYSYIKNMKRSVAKQNDRGKPSLL